MSKGVTKDDLAHIIIFSVLVHLFPKDVYYIAIECLIWTGDTMPHNDFYLSVHSSDVEGSALCMHQM